MSELEVETSFVKLSDETSALPDTLIAAFWEPQDQGLSYTGPRFLIHWEIISGAVLSHYILE